MGLGKTIDLSDNRGLMLRKPGKMLDGINLCGGLARPMLMLLKHQNNALAVWASSDLSADLGMFAPIFTARFYCAHYSLGTSVLRHTSSARTKQNTTKCSADGRYVNLV